MPKQSNVTLNHIHLAIEQLEAAGKPVTVRNVMAITGGTTADVSEMIKVVQKQRAEAKRALAALNPQVLAAIQQEVDAHVATHVAAYVQEVAQQESQFAELHELLRHAERRAEDAEAKISAMEGELGSVKKKAETDRDLAAKTLGAREAQLEAKDSEIVSLRHELNATRTDIAGLQHLSSTVAELKGELKETRGELRKAEGRAATAEGQLEELRRHGKVGRVADTAEKKALKNSTIS